MKVVVGAVAAALLAVPAADAYRNPTPGRALVLQLPGMHRAKVKRNVVYARGLRMDVYRPRKAKGPLPAVLLGGPPGNGRSSGQKIGWAQLISASGMAAVAFDIRPDSRLASPQNPSEDVQEAIAYVRARGRALGIDANRLCTLGFSFGTAPWHLWATMRDPRPWLRCNVVYYGPLDFDDPALEEFSALTYLRRHGARIPPMLVVKAGREENPGINESIDRFVPAARVLHADVRVTTNAAAHHGFDIAKPTARSRAVVRETLRFLRARLKKPLRLHESCASAAERASALRFFASDDMPLAGVLLGSGPRGLVLAHGSSGDLCSWISYARDVAGKGYRVLAYSARAGVRVDLDAEAAVEALRRAGAERIIVAGSSLGALASVIAGATLPVPPDAVVSLSAPSSYGPLDGIAAARRLRVPVLFAAAEGDGAFADDAQALYAAAGSADRRLEIVPGHAHGVQMLEEPGALATVNAWIAAHML